MSAATAFEKAQSLESLTASKRVAQTVAAKENTMDAHLVGMLETTKAGAKVFPRAA